MKAARTIAFLATILTLNLRRGIATPSSKRTFTINYDEDRFEKDGKPFRYISGSVHYFRSAPSAWPDILTNARACGLNAIQTYVEWRGHEPSPGHFHFSDEYDLVGFLRAAQDAGLLVLLRLGPYIDSERDMGGLPYWLLNVDPEMKLRTSDSNYMFFVERWFDTFLPMIKPLLYQNGGPVIALQVENEYGSYPACDRNYTATLRDLVRQHVGPDVVLYTTDGNGDSFLRCGVIEDVYATVDFGPGENVTKSFEAQREYEARGPLVNSEYYSGRLDHWGEPHQTKPIPIFLKTLEEILKKNASVNIYMFHGGTSFGFSSGSHIWTHSTFRSCPTSYDFDAPLDESGNPTRKYFALRHLLSHFIDNSSLPDPVFKPKTFSKKPVTLKKTFSLLEHYHLLPKTHTLSPPSFEDLLMDGAFLLYKTKIKQIPSDPAVLDIKGLHDRAYIYVNKKFSGVLSREEKISVLPLQASQNDTLRILVENQGRVCYGKDIADPKGILGSVELDKHTLTEWTTYLVDLKLILKTLPKMFSPLGQDDPSSQAVPAVYTGTFTLEDNGRDTYLKLDGWHKGVAVINGINIGRYWPIRGPQQTLYVPSGFLTKGINEIQLFELEHAPCGEMGSCEVRFVDTPIIDGPVPN